jgi:hypothetical protein
MGREGGSNHQRTQARLDAGDFIFSRCNPLKRLDS